jgi:DNA-binding response OmpR family regulator
MKILVIEDNKELSEQIIKSIQSEGFLCVNSHDYNHAEEKVSMYKYDIALVDINLPGGSGLDIIRKIKTFYPETGIIVISARNSLENKIEGLDLGADDYLTKPFAMVELIARLKSLIRRRNFSGNNIIETGSLKINSVNREVFVMDTQIDLTKIEFDILVFFVSNTGRVITRESLAEHIWGDNMDLSDSFDFIYSHIKNLRKKITIYNAPDPIQTIYGIGYKFLPSLNL